MRGKRRKGNERCREGSDKVEKIGAKKQKEEV